MQKIQNQMASVDAMSYEEVQEFIILNGNFPDIPLHLLVLDVNN